MIRLSAATLLVGAAGATFWPQVVSYVSMSAVVNAPVVQVKAPFEGVITSVSVERAGAPVHQDSVLLSLTRARATTGEIAAIDAEAHVVAAEISSVETQISSVEAIASDLSMRIATHRVEAGLLLTAKDKILSTDIEKAKAEHDLAKREFGRLGRLAASGTVSKTEVDSARAQVSMAQAELDRARGESAMLKVEAAALEKGIVLASNGEYARQRLDEVGLLLADLRARLAILKARASSIATTRGVTETNLVVQQSFAPASAIQGIVWRAAPKIGSQVAAGDTLVELLDCDRRFLEVSLPERYFERIRTGDIAAVKLKGSSATLTAVVSAVAGSSVRLSDESFAAKRPQEAGNGAQILLDLPPVGINADHLSSGFCDAGRTAEVRFPRANVASLGQRVAAMLGEFRNRLLQPT